MRFNKVNLKIKTNEINTLIFSCEAAANKDGYGHFRESRFDYIKSGFFSFVFLCGGNKEEHNSRKTLSDVLNKNDNVKIIISENLEKFKGDLDLLTFETVLESISKMILIPVESYGTACELGAFTRISKETNKVVAIVDLKHKDDKSFINYGPIKLLEEMEDDRVFVATFTKSGGISYLMLNSDIEKLDQHHLINDPLNIVNYYVKKVGQDDKGIIKNLSSFLIAVLDYVCLVGFANANMIIDFFGSLLNDDKFVIEDNNIKINNDTIHNVITTYLFILESLGFLECMDGLFLANSECLASNMKNGERWIGKVLFTAEFTRTDEYLKIKSTCEDIKSKILKYGYY